ncbi:c-type cytochrome [Pedobacter hartonius]|uniref:Cytochrome c n=1 Tax=Pedobacter hartonius TaxID=425514 RepID=A0A1H4AKZ0_9SPHI|nr:c-type cytochrome [Pedobacter hartonius]SEA36334.1 cytochrome c [Pedobacter hartonius]
MNKQTLINRYLILLLVFVAGLATVVFTVYKRTTAAHPDRFGFGRAAGTDEIRALDIDVRPDGRGLPAGSGSVEPGRLIYNSKCIACHGDGEKTESPLLGEALFLNYPVKNASGNGQESNKTSPQNGTSAKVKTAGGQTDSTPKTIGTYWPYATTIFDYVRRAMPYNAPGSLTDQEVYHLTAYLLYRNRIISAQTVINEKSLPKIVMPAKEKYVEDDREGGTELK